MTQESLLGAFEEMVLLAVAEADGDSYGMSVRRSIQSRSGRDVTIGAVYATLDRLEAKGLVRSRHGAASDERKGLARRHFAIEPEGARALLRARSLHQRMWGDVDIEALNTTAERSR